jgi:hypothetical protein
MRIPNALVIVAINAALCGSVACGGSAAAPDPVVTSFTISLSNNGTQAFLTPFPDIQIQGASTQAVVTPAGAGKFSYDLVVHVVAPNPNSAVTGTVTFDFGSAGAFSATVNADAISGPPTDIAGTRTTVTTVPFTFAKGSGQFVSASGSGTLVLTNQRASDTSPTSSFVSTGTMNLTGRKS